MIQSVLLRFSCGALVTLSLLLTPGLHAQCSDDIFCSLVLLFNCLDWFLWSAHQIPVTIPGLLKENVYPAASQITKALRRVPEIFVISAFIYYRSGFLSATERRVETEATVWVGSHLQSHPWVWSGPKCQSGLCFSLGYKTKPCLKKATNKTTGFPDVILAFSISSISYTSYIGF